MKKLCFRGQNATINNKDGGYLFNWGKKENLMDYNVEVLAVSQTLL